MNNKQEILHRPKSNSHYSVTKHDSDAQELPPEMVGNYFRDYFDKKLYLANIAPDEDSHLASCNETPIQEINDAYENIEITNVDYSNRYYTTPGLDEELISAPISRNETPEIRNTPSASAYRNIYIIALMSDLPNGDKNMAEPLTIYVENDGKYVVRSVTDKQQIYEGMLSGIDLSNLEMSKHDISVYKAIVGLTSKATHTNLKYAAFFEEPCSFFHRSRSSTKRSPSTYFKQDTPPAIPPADATENQSDDCELPPNLLPNLV